MATLRLGSRRARGSETGAAPRIRASGPVRAVLAVAALVLLLVVTAVVALRAELRTREIDDTKRSLLNLNALLAESTSRLMESVDLVVLSVLEDMRLDGVTTPAAIARLKGDRRFQESLKTRVSGLPQLDAISVTEADGKLVSFSRAFPIPDLDLADREHFRRVRETGSAEAVIGDPVLNRSTGRWTFFLARRIVGADGVFLGAVYGVIDLGFFAASYGRLLVEPGVSVSLWRLDGTLFVRHPEMADVGRRFDTPAFRDLKADSPPIVYETKAAIDGQRRVVIRHVVQGFPIATIISRRTADIVAQVRQETIALLLAGLLLAAAVVAVTVALVRQFWAYEAVARAERERALAVADLGELQDQLRQSQKLEVIGQLASGIAHDFNNLLTVVIGNLDRLTRRYGGGDADLARYVEGARSGADRAAALSRRLLAFSRRKLLEAQRLDLDETIVNLTDLLQQALGRKAKLELALAGNLPPIRADRDGLESALLNLVVNARDAMPGGGTVTVSTRAGRDRTVEVTVADTGTGMSPEVAQRAFEPFFTTKEAGVGTGLGLAQVADFVRQNGGAAAIRSESGQGCRITFSLPADAGPPSQQDTA